MRASTPRRLDGGAVGVFVGAMGGDYGEMAAAAGEGAVNRYSLTGVSRSIAANRISHSFGFGGPSLVVDSGQSSSLVAVHMACESLRSGESEVALAGGVHLNLSPLSFLRVGEFGALSPDGRCYVFDARANGIVRGEGGGMLVLKPLARALADGDRIHALIAGSAAGSGTGATGLTAPGEAVQARVIGQALERAAIDPATVGYVELHGTGTAAGDPVEAAALAQAYGAGRTVPLAVGSIKTNIGHLEGAAGIAGLLKAVLCLRRGELVPSLHFAEPNPAIDLEALALRVVTAREPWEAPAAAGVTSIGMGGMTCHVVLAPPPPPPTPRARKGTDPLVVTVARLRPQRRGAARAGAAAA